MMVKKCDEFNKHHLGGQGMLECVCVCVCRVQDFEFWEGERNSKVRC